MINVAQKYRTGPPRPGITDINPHSCIIGEHSSLHDSHDRIAGRKGDHSAQHCSTKGYSKGKTLRLSDRYPFINQESGVTLRNILLLS